MANSPNEVHLEKTPEGAWQATIQAIPDMRAMGSTSNQTLAALKAKFDEWYRSRVKITPKDDQGNRIWKWCGPFLALPVAASFGRWLREASFMSRDEVLEQFSECWEGLDDPRNGNAALHDFHELLLIALCAVLAGGQGAVDMALFAKAKEAFLRSFLKLENGPPSHDTFSRLFRNLDPEQFRASFQRFIAKFSEGCQGVVAIDGKVLRRSFDRASGKSALCMVSAWGCEQRLVLAQIATDAKSNEITAVPKLLEMLALKDTIVTADALHCQRDTAAQIVEQGGEYALALKANQSAMYDDVKLFFDDPECEAVAGPPLVETSRDRIETRTATVWTDIGWIEKSHRWPALAAIGRVVRVREADGKTTSETAYYLLSQALSPDRLNTVVRSHWQIENRLHWRLDVVMNEDQDRTRLGHGPENLAVLRHMVLNAMQKEGSKSSLRGKFKRAGWDHDFLIRLLAMF